MEDKDKKEERTILFNVRAGGQPVAKYFSTETDPKRESNRERIARIMQSTSYTFKVK